MIVTVTYKVRKFIRQYSRAQKRNVAKGMFAVILMLWVEDAYKEDFLKELGKYFLHKIKIFKHIGFLTHAPITR